MMMLLCWGCYLEDNRTCDHLQAGGRRDVTSGPLKGKGPPGLGWEVLDPFQVQILLDTNFVSNSDRQAKAGGRRATRAYRLRQFDLRFTDDWNDEAKPRSGMRNSAPY